MNIEKIKYFLNLIGHGVNIVDPDLMEEDMVEAGKWSEDDGHNPDDEALNLGVTLERLLVLESAVAFKPIDEMPTIGLFDMRRMDVKDREGNIFYDVEYQLNEKGDKCGNTAKRYYAIYINGKWFSVTETLTGWRYPVGDLSE